jgi:hypothetical protein
VNNQGRQYPNQNQNQQGRQFQRFPQNNQRYVPTNLGNQQSNSGLNQGQTQQVANQRGSGQSNQRVSGDGGASGSLSASSESGVGGSSGPISSASLPEQVLDPRYSKLICFNCGDPGHFVGNCVKPKLCFICNLPGHPVHLCPKWLTEHPSAAYFGSAGKGLGFTILMFLMKVRLSG